MNVGKHREIIKIINSIDPIKNEPILFLRQDAQILKKLDQNHQRQTFLESFELNVDDQTAIRTFGKITECTSLSLSSLQSPS
jgi:hypothetical protein